MAKRDIPEINAGSMADIAFLLLIFFLVTTTMDRDKAYKRSIPKKIELKDQPIVKVEDRNIFAIRANANNEIMIRGERITDPNTISEKVLEFYRMNEKLTNEQTAAAAANPNHPGYNFPFYSRLSMKQIEDNLRQAEDNLDAADQDPNGNTDMINFYSTIVDKWDAKKDALKLYGKSTLPEIHVQAHIRIETQTETDYATFAKIQSEIEEAIYELRNEAAKDLWGVGYRSITAKIDTDPDNAKEEEAQAALLELLYRSSIVEVTPTN